eukprot:scaffold529056_cov29-Prasinocladus_malaysianus.AAC.1
MEERAINATGFWLLDRQCKQNISWRSWVEDDHGKITLRIRQDGMEDLIDPGIRTWSPEELVGDIDDDIFRRQSFPVGYTTNYDDAPAG